MIAFNIESFADAIANRGWAVTPPLVDDGMIAQLRTIVGPLATDRRGGARNLLDLPAIQELAASDVIRGLSTAVLGGECFAVRGLLFDKTPDANWKVIWHQDLSIATSQPAEVDGYGPWTEKAGVPHVQPPVSILENMLAVRVHLDPCGVDNGPVRVLDGSHRLGRLSGESIDALRQSQPATDCVVAQGGVLAFRPLILHASGPATAAHHRRVIHIEFAANELASPLTWHRRIA